MDIGPSDRDPQRVAGFTLIEMLVVLTLLALMAGLSGPVLGRIAAGRTLDRFGEALREQITLTRAAAIRSGRATALSFDAPTATFRSDAGSTPLAVPATVAAVLETALSRRRAQGVIHFLPDGRSSGGTIRLERQGDVLRLSIGRLTGAVRRDRGSET